MEQEWQNDAGALTAQAIPQKDVEQACFHALGLVGRNCEYLEQHLARVGADEQTRQAVNDISAAAARLDRTMNEVMTLLDFLRAEEPPAAFPAGPVPDAAADRSAGRYGAGAAECGADAGLWRLDVLPCNG